MLQTKDTSKIFLLLSVVFALIAVVGTIVLLSHYSKGGLYLEAELTTWEIGVSSLLGYTNLLFASLCFAQYALVSDKVNSKIVCLARKTSTIFGYSVFLLSIAAVVYVCFSFSGRDFLFIRCLMAFIYPFMLGMLCIAFSSKLR